MTTGTTTLLGLALPVEGDLSGTWGDVVNNSITSLVDSAIAGTTTLSTDSDVTLTTTPLAANQAREAVLLWTASNGATTRYITAPAQSKTYIVINAGTGIVGLRGAGPTTGITVAVGEKCLAAWNGSDFVAPAVSSGTVTSVGGTGTVNGISLSGTVTSSGSLTLGGTLSGVSLTTQVSGTLPVANGGTGVTTSTGTGNVVLSTSPTLTTPILGTPTSGNLSSCTADGTNAVGYKNIPQSGSDKTTAYTLTTTDVGKYIGVGASGSIVVPTSTFANGDAISIFNNTSGNITITTSAPTAYIAGTNTVKTSVTLATRGVANILFVSATVCILTGNVS